MQLKHIKPGIYEVKLHSLELATLISAARWAAAGAEGELTPEAIEQLKQVVKNYDIAMEVSNSKSRKGISNTM